MTRKYVLTGGPGTGKSTLVSLMNNQKIYTIGEAATWIIKLEEKIGGDALPWTNREAFQKKVLETQLEWEREIPEEIETAFLDRGLHDGIAYYKINGLEPPKELTGAARKANYNKIFILDPIKRYEQTGIRRESKEESAKIHEEIRKTYEEFGYEPIRIPDGSPEYRTELILKEIFNSLAGESTTQ